MIAANDIRQHMHTEQVIWTWNHNYTNWTAIVEFDKKRRDRVLILLTN